MSQEGMRLFGSPVVTKPLDEIVKQTRTTFVVYRTDSSDEMDREIDWENINDLPPRPCDNAELVEVERFYWDYYNPNNANEFTIRKEKQWIVKLTMSELIELAGLTEDGVIVHPLEDGQNPLHPYPKVFWYEGNRVPVLEIYDGYRE